MIEIESGSPELKIHAWFPTLVGLSMYPDHRKEAPAIIKHLQKIKKKCPPSTGSPSFFLHPCHKDSKLKNLNHWIQARVNDYTKFYGFPKKCKPVESWFHCYKRNNNNPVHVHLGRTISIIYSPTPVDMRNPFNITANDAKEDLKNHFTCSECFYKPLEGMLLIFRSYVHHGTELKMNNFKDRILISWDLK